MTWSDVFIDSASPTAFDPSVTTTTWNSDGKKTTTSTKLDALINAVVARINSEARLISKKYTVTLDSLKARILNYSSLTYQQRFQALVDQGRSELTTLRDDSVSTGFNAFFRRYYFYVPEGVERRDLINGFKSQDYGFGDSVREQQKLSALNRAINSGLLSSSTTLEQFESLTDPQNPSLLADAIIKVTGDTPAAVIDPDVIRSAPVNAADALVKLKTSDKLQLNSTGRYIWKKGYTWRDLSSFSDGKLLTTYQSLLNEYEKSGSGQNGVTLSQYIASKNKEAFDELSKQVTSARQVLKPTNEDLDIAKSTIENVMQIELDKALKNVGLSSATTQQKLALLQADAYQQASRALSIQQASEDSKKAMNIFRETNSVFQEMARDLGVKEDFFNEKFLQSNINFNWQKWFDTELAARYNPNNPSNQVGKIVGTSAEDAMLAANFVKSFLQRRFDGSKSLSEFRDYLNPSNPNPVLQQTQEEALKKLSSGDFSVLAGSITDSDSPLGNFWTGLQRLWQKGRSFDTTYYLTQPLTNKQGNEFKVEDLHENIKLMLDLAAQKGRIGLTIFELKTLPLKGVDMQNNSDVGKQAALLKSWFDLASAKGVDLYDPIAFARLHYDTYSKDPTNQILAADPGKTLYINDPDLLGSTEAQMLNRQAEMLIVKASDYATELQFGKFKTPEEFVSEILKDSPLLDAQANKAFSETGYTDVISEFVGELSGVVAGYAGETMRKRIRELIDNSQSPDQEELGVDYIQRTKEQALATIRNLINQDAFTNTVVIDNAPGLSVGQDISDWFSSLGLELIPGDAWKEYKEENNIPIETDFNQWSQKEGAEIDPVTNKTKLQSFWNKWSIVNGVDTINTGTQSDPRVTLTVRNPTSAWISWAKRITLDLEKDDVFVKERLNGAQVSVRSNQFNADWYSKTNPYTKSIDDWNAIVAKPTQEIVRTQGKTLGQWAQSVGLNPEGAWTAYRNTRQKMDSKFGKDIEGNDLSYRAWAEKAYPSEINEFWRNSSPYWYEYLSSMGVVKGGDQDKPVFKTWGEWAIENNIELKRADLDKKVKPPYAFMQIHYGAMGGSTKIDEQYLKTYFPEYEALTRLEIQKKDPLTDTPFSLSEFGFNDETSFMAFKPVTSTNRKSISPIDFAMNQMFGDSLSNNSSDPFSDLKTDFNASTDTGFDLGIDKTYNTYNTKKKIPIGSFGFGDFGGSDFGFG